MKRSIEFSTLADAFGNDGFVEIGFDEYIRSCKFLNRSGDHNKIKKYQSRNGFQIEKRLSIRRMVVKELLKGINVPLGTFDAQYDIENTSVWSLGGQRIFLRKTSYLSSILLISMKFGENKKKNENTPAQSAKNVVCAGVKFKNIFDILRRRIFIFLLIFRKTSC